MPELAEVSAIQSYIQTIAVLSPVIQTIETIETLDDDQNNKKSRLQQISMLKDNLPLYIHKVHSKGKENWMVLSKEPTGAPQFYLFYHFMLSGEVIPCFETGTDKKKILNGILMTMTMGSEPISTDNSNSNSIHNNSTTALYFRDQKKMMTMVALNKDEADHYISNIAKPFISFDPNIIAITPDEFQSNISKSKRSILSMLQIQKIDKGAIVSGCGQWMIKESLSQCEISPKIKCCDLSTSKLSLLFHTLSKLASAIYNQLKIVQNESTKQEQLILLQGLYARSKPIRKSLCH